MELQSLSDIFDDPLLNDFGDTLLNDIDLHEFENLPCDDGLCHTNHAQQIPLANHNHAALVNISETSDSTTLEALLKSGNPSRCVPPAPELYSRNASKDGGCAEEVLRYNYKCSPPRRNSVPIIKSDLCWDEVTPNGDVLKPKLICDYLEKSVNVIQLLSDRRVSLKFDGELSKPVPNGIAKYHKSQPPHKLVEALQQYSTDTNHWNRDADAIHEETKTDCKGSRRAPHNAIEKRYRASINGRIDELRQLLVPHPTSDMKLNKSSVLRQAIERIKELEENNTRLTNELNTMRLIQGTDRLSYESPESGILSLEPSPSSSSNFNTLDVGSYSPPSSSVSSASLFGSSGHLVNLLPNSFEFTDLNQPSQLCNKKFHMRTPISEHLTRSGSCIGLPDAVFTCPPEASIKPSPSCNEAEQFSPSSNLNTSPESNVSIVRKHLKDSSTSFSHGMTSRPHNRELITHTASKRPMSDHEYVLSKYRRQEPPIEYRLQEGYGPVVAAGENRANEKDDLGYHSQQGVTHLTSHCTEGFTSFGTNSITARTTLCVAALCLITLNPSILTGEKNQTSTATHGSASSSRRLLSVQTTLTSWSALMVYVLQWMIAIGLCLWACGKRTWCCRDKRVHADSMQTAAYTHMNNANAARKESQWTTVEHELYSCLSVLDSRSHLQTTVDLNANLISRTFRKISSPSTKCNSIVTGMWKICKGFLRFRRSVMSDSKTETTDRLSFEVCSRSSLIRESYIKILELYLLVPKNRNMDLKNFPAVNYSTWVRLLSNCLCAYMDGVVEQKCRFTQVTRHRDESLLRLGSMVALAMNELGWPHRLRRFVLFWLKRSAGTISEKSSFWFQFITEPDISIAIANQDGFLDRQFLSGFGYNNSPIVTSQSLAHRCLYNRCLEILVHQRSCDLPKHETLFTTLLHSDNPQEESSSESDESSMSDHSLWWARIIYTLWEYRCRLANKHTKSDDGSNADDQFSDSSSIEISPPATMNRLSQALWLIYCLSTNIYDTSGSSVEFQSSTLANQTSVLLKRSLSSYLSQAETFASASGKEQSFSITALHVLAADWLIDITKSFLLPTSPASPKFYRIQFMSAFDAATLVLKRFTSLLPMTNKPAWILNKISYSEVLKLILLGANPVRSRLALMHNCHSDTKSSGFDDAVVFDRFYQFGDELLTSSATNRSAIRGSFHRASLITQSPGQ